MMSTPRTRYGGLWALVACLPLGCGQGGSGRSDGGPGDASADANGITCPPTESVREEITAEGVTYPRIVSDRAGGVHVAYELYNAGPQYPAVYAYRDPGGTWTRETVIDWGTEGLALAVGAEGTVHIVKSDDELIHAFREVGGEWQYETVAMPSGIPAMALDAMGGVYVCGHSPFDGMACAYRSPEGEWSIEPISPGGTVNGFKAMAVGPDGSGHVLFGAYDFGVWMRIGHAWRAAEGGSWATEWVTEPDNSFSRGISLAIDAPGTLHGAFSNEINTNVTTRTFDLLSTTLRYLRKSPGDSEWTSEDLLAEADDPWVFIPPDGSVAVLFAPRLPFQAAHGFVFAERSVDGIWRQNSFSCGAVLAAAPQASSDGCCVHLAFNAQGSSPLPLAYERYCPEQAPALEISEGSCLTDTCQAEVAACEDVWCAGDSDPVSTCERGAMNLFPDCESYDMNDQECVDPTGVCPEIQDTWESLVSCIRDRCYTPCE